MAGKVTDDDKVEKTEVGFLKMFEDVKFNLHIRKKIKMLLKFFFLNN